MQKEVTECRTPISRSEVSCRDNDTNPFAPKLFDLVKNGNAKGQQRKFQNFLDLLRDRRSLFRKISSQNFIYRATSKDAVVWNRYDWRISVKRHVEIVGSSAVCRISAVSKATRTFSRVEQKLTSLGVY